MTPEELDQSAGEQARVQLRAHEKFLERNAVYEDLWRGMPADELITHMYSKVRRAGHLAELGKDAEDDVLDLINYAIFFIRCGYATAPAPADPKVVNTRTRLAVTPCPHCDAGSFGSVALAAHILHAHPEVTP